MIEMRELELRAVAASCGLELQGYSAVDPLTHDAARLAAWQARGFAGEMRFMERDPALLSDPTRLLPNARSVFIFGVRYGAAPPPDRPAGFGRVARYAWGRDYHVVLRERLNRLDGELKAKLGDTVFLRSFSDSVPLLERAFAARAGLGFIGKNTMLIVPRTGSFLFLAEMVSNISVKRHGLPVVKGGCGGCFRCGPACPTGAIVEPYVLDARRCISYLTIEKRSALAPAERRAIGEWLFGCDICQDVCPFNHGAIKSGQPPALAEFEPGMGVGPVVDLAGIVDIPSEGEFRRRFSHTALSRARRKTLIRNAVIVAANTGAVGLTARIARRVHEDPSPLVRQHALWAVWMLEHHFRAGLVDVGVLLERARRDSAPEVRDEARDISEGIV